MRESESKACRESGEERKRESRDDRERGQRCQSLGAQERARKKGGCRREVQHVFEKVGGCSMWSTLSLSLSVNCAAHRSTLPAFKFTSLLLSFSASCGRQRSSKDADRTDTHTQGCCFCITHTCEYDPQYIYLDTHVHTLIYIVIF